MKRTRDYEGEILEMGFDTEAKGSGDTAQFRALQGTGPATAWHPNWLAVLHDLCGRKALAADGKGEK